MVDAADSKSAIRKDVKVRFLSWAHTKVTFKVAFFYILMFTVYVIKSIERNYIYVGITDNLDRRLNQHQTGQNKTTKPYLPFVLIRTEQFETRLDARKREIYLKSGVGKEYLKSLLQ